MTKETYTCDKRDLYMRQKRPTHVTKETYTCGKRDLLRGRSPSRPSSTGTKEMRFFSRRRDRRFVKRPSDVGTPVIRFWLCGQVSKEAYLSRTRDLVFRTKDLIKYNKRPNQIQQET